VCGPWYVWVFFCTSLLDPDLAAASTGSGPLSVPSFSAGPWGWAYSSALSSPTSTPTNPSSISLRATRGYSRVRPSAAQLFFTASPPLFMSPGRAETHLISPCLPPALENLAQSIFVPSPTIPSIDAYCTIPSTPLYTLRFAYM